MIKRMVATEALKATQLRTGWVFLTLVIISALGVALGFGLLLREADRAFDGSPTAFLTPKQAISGLTGIGFGFLGCFGAWLYVGEQTVGAHAYTALTRASTTALMASKAALAAAVGFVLTAVLYPVALLAAAATSGLDGAWGIITEDVPVASWLLVPVVGAVSATGGLIIGYITRNSLLAYGGQLGWVIVGETLASNIRGTDGLWPRSAAFTFGNVPGDAVTLVSSLIGGAIMVAWLALGASLAYRRLDPDLA